MCVCVFFVWGGGEGVVGGGARGPRILGQWFAHARMSPHRTPERGVI